MDVPLNHLLLEAPPRQLFPRAMHILFSSAETLSPITRDAVFSTTVHSVRAGVSVRDLHTFRRCAEKSTTSSFPIDFTPCDETVVRERSDMALHAALASAAAADDSSVSHSEWLTAQLCLAGVYADTRDHAAASKVLRRVSDAVMSSDPPHSKALEALEALEALAVGAEVWIACGDLDAVRGALFADGAAPLVAARAVASASANSSSHHHHHHLHSNDSEDLVARRFARAVLVLSLARALCLLDDGDFAGFAWSFSGAGLRGAGWAPSAEEWATRRYMASLSASLAGRIAQQQSTAPCTSPSHHSYFKSAHHHHTTTNTTSTNITTTTTTTSTTTTTTTTSTSTNSTMRPTAGENSCASCLPPVAGLRAVVAQRIASAPQLGAVIVLAASAALPHDAALELFLRADVAQLYHDIPAAMAVVRAMEKSQFGEVAKAADILAMTYVRTDVLAHQQCDALCRQLRHTIIASFTSGFARLNVSRAAETLGMTAEALLKTMRQLAANGQLHGRVDVVQQQWSAEENEAETLEECLRRADESAWDVEQSLRVLALLRNRI